MQNVNLMRTVQKNDCAWKVAKRNLQDGDKTKKVKNADIIIEMNRLAKVNGCKDYNEFNKKFFSSVGGQYSIGEAPKVTEASPAAATESALAPAAAAAENSQNISEAAATVPATEGNEVTEATKTNAEKLEKAKNTQNFSEKDNTTSDDDDFKSLDTSGDGKITFEEYKNNMMQLCASSMDITDANKAQVEAALKESFDAMSKDGIMTSDLYKQNGQAASEALMNKLANIDVQTQAGN